MSVRQNIVANISGSLWSALMGIVFIPYYIKAMGVEAYALVGVFISLQAIFAVLDMGLSQALTREMARLSVKPESRHEMAFTIKTLEVIYWILAICVVLVSSGLSHWFAYNWFNPGKLLYEEVERALFIIGILIAVRWPLTLYISGMNGLQRQVSVNFINIFFATVQGVGSVAVLWLIKPTVEVFFLWQGAVACAQVFVTRYFLWRDFKGIKSSFSIGVLMRLWQFSLGMMGISLLSTALTQLDKIFLSKLLSLEDFGYYVFASTIASMLFKLTGPIFVAILPRFIQLRSDGSDKELARLYHSGSQLMALVVIPIASVLFFFSKDIILFWTGDQALTHATAGIVGVLILGNAINGLMSLPYALQVSYSWLSLPFYQTLFSVALLSSFIYFGAGLYGSIGAAYAWLILSLYSLVVTVIIMHIRILRGEMKRWYRDSVVVPSVVAGAVGYGGSLLISDVSGWFGIWYVGLCALTTVFFVLISLPVARERIKLLF